MNRNETEKLQQLKRHLRLWLRGTLTCLLAAPSLCLAEAVTVQAQVNAAIDTYVAELHGQRFSRVESEIQPLDSRLQLQPCDQPLVIDHRPRDRMAGRLTFKTTCPGSQPWTIHVPASVKTFASVVVAASSIPMGSQLTAQQVTLEEQDVSLLHRGYFQEIQAVSGFVTKRPIPAGQVLTPQVIDPAKLVSKGENVAIVAEGAGITIRAYGVSLMDGAMGQLIQVRNTKSNKVVEGRITAPGQIRVSL